MKVFFYLILNVAFHKNNAKMKYELPSPWVLHSRTRSSSVRSRTFMLSDGMWTNLPHCHFYTGTHTSNTTLEQSRALPRVWYSSNSPFSSIVTKKRRHLSYLIGFILLSDEQGVELQEDQLRLLLTLSWRLLIMLRVISWDWDRILSIHFRTYQVISDRIVDFKSSVCIFCRSTQGLIFSWLTQPVRKHPSHNRTTMLNCLACLSWLCQPALYSHSY